MVGDSRNLLDRGFVGKHFCHIKKEVKFLLFDLYFPELGKLSIA
jgi:hypothetical protein